MSNPPSIAIVMAMTHRAPSIIKLVSLFVSTILSLVGCSIAQSSPGPCLLLGPDYPAPRQLSTSSTVAAALQKLNSTITRSLKQDVGYGKVGANFTSFSVELYSVHEDKPLFTFHHSAPGLAHPEEGVSTVDSNTIYRVGSVSKLLSVYVFLATVGDVHFNEPVTKYVPELAAYAAQNKQNLQGDDSDYFDWESMTLGALASHSAGIFKDFAVSPAVDEAYVQIGLPPAPAVAGSFCNSTVGQIPCNRPGTLF